MAEETSSLKNERESMYQLMQNGPGMVVITDYQGKIIAVNNRAVKETGFTEEEILGQNPRLWNSGRQSKEFYEELWQTIKSGEIWEGTFCNQKKNGELFWSRAIIVPVSDDSGEIVKFASVHDIITEQYRLRQRLQATVDTAKSAIITMGNSGVIESVNPATLEIFECLEQDLVGQKIEVIMPETFNLLNKYKETGKPLLLGERREETVETVRNKQFPADVEVNDFETDTGQKFVAIAIDRTEEVEYRNEIEELNEELAEKNKYLEQLSIVDPLTDLPNRRRFEEKLEENWERCLRDSQQLSVVLLDIDNFKDYNDHYGHPAGDDCLKKVAEVMNDTVKRAIDTVARYGGEEFIAILPETDLDGAGQLAEDLRREIEAAEVEHEKSEVSDVVTVSAGVATAVPKQDQDEWGLVEAADRALYEAKEKGRNQVVTSKVENGT